MATTPNLSHSEFIQEIITTPLSPSSDLFVVVDTCTSFVCVLVENNNPVERLALCGRLTQALKQLENLCEEALPQHLIDALTADFLPASPVPDCWEDSSMLLGYTLALTSVLASAPGNKYVEKELTGLLHDLVFLLAEQLKTPFLLHPPHFFSGGSPAESKTVSP